MIEANFFYEEPKRHYKITAETLDELAERYLAVSTFEEENFAANDIAEDPSDPGYRENLPVDGSLNTPTAPEEAAQPPQPVTVVSAPTRPEASAVKCGVCGGGVYDEHKSKFWGNGLGKSGGRKPDWKCRDRNNCGAVAYDEYTVDNAYAGIGDWRYPKL